MSDPLDKITEGRDLVGKIRNWLSGFLGYVDRENRRDADKLIRQEIALRYEKSWNKISELQRQLVSEGKLDQLDELEAAAIKLRTFIDRVKTASYGYAGFFDAVRIQSEEIDKMYAFDIALLENGDAIQRAVENVEASLGTDGAPAAIRHLITLSQQAIEAYDERDQVILSTNA